jgi:hypothetical protein
MSFTFFIKPKKVVVDAFTSKPYVYECSPIKPAVHFLPNWWKSIPPTYELEDDNGVKTKNSTIKRCDGFIDHYKTGFIIPLWSDLNISISNDFLGYRFGYKFSDECSEIRFHDVAEFGSTFSEYQHMKIISPWFFREKSGVNFAFIQPTWNQINLTKNIIFPPGTINYKHQCGTNINIFFKKYQSIQYELEFGMPLAHILPLTEKRIVIKNHLISDNEIQKMTSEYGTRIKFLGKYKTKLKIEKEQNKCPFNFR